MSVLHLAAKFGQLKVIDMLWGKTPIDQVSLKVWIKEGMHLSLSFISAAWTMSAKVFPYF